MPDRWIVIPNWDGPTGFQHYKDRTPRWIKNYVELMSDDAYLGLTGHRRAILHGLWMEYARSRRQLADNTATLSRRLSLKVTSRDLKALNDAGFIQFSASDTLAQPEHPASPDKKRKELLARAVPVTRPAADDEPDIGPNGTAPESHTIRNLIDQSLATAPGAAQ